MKDKYKVYTIKDYMYYALLCIIGGIIFYIAGYIGLALNMK